MVRILIVSTKVSSIHVLDVIPQEVQILLCGLPSIRKVCGSVDQVVLMDMTKHDLTKDELLQLMFNMKTGAEIVEA